MEIQVGDGTEEEAAAELSGSGKERAVAATGPWGLRMMVLCSLLGEQKEWL